ncbi:MAG TPA: hypothetical protein VKB19_12545 [Pedobacter sp.]|nr:hypothetical protein [Pedobacter sp.]
MFRKLHSNPDKADQPPATVFSELRREFGRYYHHLVNCSKALLKKYPKVAFAAMILLMLGSLVLSFTDFRRKPVKTQRSASEVSMPLENGFGEILSKGASLQQMITLKQEIEILLAKDSLSHLDSLQLSGAIDTLHQLSIRSSH